MDEYFYLIQDEETDGLLLNNQLDLLHQKASIKQNSSNSFNEITNVSDILHSRNRAISIAKLRINSASKNKHGAAIWSNAMDAKINDIEGGYNTICEAINDLCNEMPLPGSCIVNVHWYRGDNCWNKSTDIQPAISFIGSIKKLVDWHNAEFTMIATNPSTHDGNVASFISSSNCIISKDEYRSNCDTDCDVVWRGSFDFISEGELCQEINGINIKMAFNQNQENLNTTEDDTPQSCFLWLGRRASVMEMINVYSVPIYLLTGSACLVDVSQSVDKMNASSLSELYDKMVENSCLLCMVDYSVSQDVFAAGPEYGISEWKNATAKENFTPPKVDPHKATSVIHFILYRDHNCSRKGFVCQFLQPLEAYFNELFNSIGIENVFDNADTLIPKSLPEISALENLDKVNQNKQNVVQKTAAKSIDSMFFQHKDVLKHFTKSGKPRVNCSYLSQKSTSQIDPKDLKLMNFNDALKIQHHGIFFNKNDDNSEKRDRESRRLINQFVKFETASISSKAKVTLPSLYVEESPGKSKSTGKENTNAATAKQKKWERVAEKLYQKRLQSRSQSTSNMVLRSTPKKNMTRKQSLHEIRPPHEKKSTTSRYQNYVQGNRQLLQGIITKVLAKEGVTPQNPKFKKCFEKLYDVSMTFLKDLKSSKDLKAVINRTVEENVKTVLTFFEINS